MTSQPTVTTTQLCDDNGTALGADYACSGGAHIAGATIRCSSPAHAAPAPFADRIPAPRPVPTTTARLADARACGHTPEQHRHDDGQAADAASHDRAIRELETELERATNQRDAAWKGNAQLAAERDRFARDHASAEQVATYRQGVIDLHGAELGAAGEVIAVVRDAQEQIERALARYDTQPDVTPVEPEKRHPGDALADALRNAYTTEQLAGLHEDLTHALDDDAPREDPLGRLVDALFSARWHKQPGLGSAPPHAQDDRHAQGYAEAIAHLRDDARYMHWWSSTGVQPAGPLRQHLADYLETVGPDGPTEATS